MDFSVSSPRLNNDDVDNYGDDDATVVEKTITLREMTTMTMITKTMMAFIVTMTTAGILCDHDDDDNNDDVIDDSQL